MMRVLPAIIPNSRSELSDWLDHVDYAPMVQVDIVDGVFAQPPSWPFQNGQASDFSELPVERIMLDMMVVNGVDYFLHHKDQLAKMAEIVIHFSSLRDGGDLFVMREAYEGKLLLAVMNSTPFEAYEPYIKFCDGVQVMGIAEVGKQGQPFDVDTVKTIQTLRQHFPKLDIVVDGSVNADTLEILVEAGVSRVVVGSALKNAPTPSDVYQRLLNIFPVT